MYNIMSALRHPQDMISAVLYNYHLSLFNVYKIENTHSHFLRCLMSCFFFYIGIKI